MNRGCSLSCPTHRSFPESQVSEDPHLGMGLLDPTRAEMDQLLNYLSHLYEVRGLFHGTIPFHRSAVSTCLSTAATQALGPPVTRLLRAIFLSHPPACRA